MSEIIYKIEDFYQKSQSEAICFLIEGLDPGKARRVSLFDPIRQSRYELITFLYSQDKTRPRGLFLVTCTESKHGKVRNSRANEVDEWYGANIRRTLREKMRNGYEITSKFKDREIHVGFISVIHGISDRRWIYPINIVLYTTTGPALQEKEPEEKTMTEEELILLAALL